MVAGATPRLSFGRSPESSSYLVSLVVSVVVVAFISRKVRQRTDYLGTRCYDVATTERIVKILHTVFLQADNFIVGLLIGLALVIPFLR